jgi:hypothetical protein
MNASDWLNIAKCNSKRMFDDKERIYTLCHTSQHERWQEVYATTRLALAQAKRASYLATESKLNGTV